MNEARAEELRAPWRAEGLMVEARDRIRGLEHEGRLDGFGDVVTNHDNHSLTVYWKGPLPKEMEDLLHELQRQVAIDVRDAPYSRDELSEEVLRINGLDLSGLRITSVGPMRDCSGLRVTVDVGNDLARASREIKSRMRLEFGIQRPAQPATTPRRSEPRVRRDQRTTRAAGPTAASSPATRSTAFQAIAWSRERRASSGATHTT
jgi:hypothetical protein